MTARNARQTAWLGGLFVLIGLTFASWFALPGPDLSLGIATAVAIAIAVALFAKWRPVRWLASLGLVAVAGDSVFELVRATVASNGAIDTLQLANAVATTVLATWLGARGAWIVIDRSRGPLRATRRLVGVVLVVVAASHLAMFRFWDPRAPAALSFNISPLGTFVIGFTGWPIWHGLLALIGLALALAPDRAARHAGALLAILVAYLIPMVFTSGFDALLMIGILAVPLYGACWLAAELRDDGVALRPRPPR
ncbi:MAG TPA: hypothetical protein VGL61_17685 [Kofleriaceae bacterium]|jgi:hypothetical protein